MEKVKSFGNDFWIHTKDTIVSVQIKNNGGYEIKENAVMHSILMQGDVCVDFGANIGVHTCEMARAVGKTGKVYAIEPETENCKVLAANVAMLPYQNVKIIKCAVSDTNKPGTLYTNPLNKGAHCLSKRCPEMTLQNVEIRKSSEVIPQNTSIKLLKLDIEGYEFKALKGLGKQIDNIEFMIMEFFPSLIVLAKDDPVEMLQFIRNSGFTISLIHDMQPKTNDWLMEKNVVGTERHVSILCKRIKANDH